MWKRVQHQQQGLSLLPDMCMHMYATPEPGPMAILSLVLLSVHDARKGGGGLEIGDWIAGYYAGWRYDDDDYTSTYP